MSVVRYKICDKCQAKNDEDAKFCTHCGNNLENVKSRVQIENGAYFDESGLDLLITPGDTPINYKTKGLIFHHLTFQYNLTDEISHKWTMLLENLVQTVKTQEIDGAANIKFGTEFHESQSNVVTITVTGNGIKKIGG